MKKLIELLDILDAFDEMREQLLIDYERKFVPAPEEIQRTLQPHVVPACESEVTAYARVDEAAQTMSFWFSVANPSGVSARALATILAETVSGRPVSELETLDPEIVGRIFKSQPGFGKGLGLRNMVAMIRTLAAFPEKINNE